MNVSDMKVTGYDHALSAHFNGSMPNLYHHGLASHITFEPTESNRYQGYDHGSGLHFEIVVSNRNAAFYDHGEGKWAFFYA
jgi:hypothetical protein